MNEQIINNLYEFWKYIGKVTTKLTEKNNYLVVSMDASDWPNRIFKVNNDKKIIEEIIKLNKEEKLPNILTITKPNFVNINTNFEFMFGQKNMALNLNTISISTATICNIKQVKTEKESISFATTASEAFGYKVDPLVVYKIMNHSKKLQLYIYQENNECLGCGIIFFDSYNNAGLHMIGTVPEGRKKGIGKSMTERLLNEAKKAETNYCVLHASLMGEPIYKKLGFIKYGEIETFKLIKS